MMKGQNMYVLSSVCMIVFSSLLVASSVAASKVETTQLVVTAKEGTTAVLTCKVANLTSHTVIWSFVTKSLHIFRNRDLLTNDPVKYSIISPLDGPNFYNLMLLNVEESDHGFYQCAIEGSKDSVSIHLQVEGKTENPVIPEPLNRTDCCIAEGVKSTCLPTCMPSSVNFTTFDVDNCDDANFKSLIGLSKCLTANSNHDNCCMFKDLHPMCLPFCHNEIPDDAGPEHLMECMSKESLDIYLECFTIGFASLPDVPQEVTVLPSSTEQSSSLVVSWQPPKRNADKVTGYKIMFKRDDKDSYYSHVIKDPNTLTHRLSGPNIIANLGYNVHVAALADQGVSMGSVDIYVFVPDESLSQSQNQLTSDCCADRDVSSLCNSLLCRSRTWSHFNFGSVAQCLPKLNDIFTCLVGERNHTSCCNTFGVSSLCQPLCSGSPPPFNEDLIVCTLELGTIEACVQQGYTKLPVPPNNVSLSEVTARSATLLFSKPKSPLQAQQYIVELHQGLAEKKSFKPYMTLSGNSESVFLNDLVPNTYYGVRIISEASVDSETFGSLPSETIYFLTYPASFEETTVAPLVNVPHDFQACCVKKGMPKICSDGCQYKLDITSYYFPIIDTCYAYIGSVLSCASDGRDHTTCCKRRLITDPDCLVLCKLTITGAIPAPTAQKCITKTPDAVACFKEGLVFLPRHPDVVVSNVTWNTISLEWEQPETSGLIDTYIVDYGIETNTLRKQVKTNNTQYIINDLDDATTYTITVSSRNENGTSVPSPLLTVNTLEKTTNLPYFNQSGPIGSQLWSNISHCCKNSGIPSQCVDMCLNKQLQSPDASCIQHSHKMLACYSDGQDHSLCCSRNPELPKTCYSLCKGQAQELTPNIASCMSYGNRQAILSCFLENSALVPGEPQKVAVKMRGPDKAEIVWFKPDSFCDDDCKSVLLYWKLNLENPNIRDVKMIKNVESPYQIENLDKDTFYTFAIRAENSHGIGPPSNQATLFFSPYKREVKIALQSDKDYVEIGQDATLQCAAIDFDPDDSYRIKWLFNNGREVNPTGTNQNILVINKVDPLRDEGTYTCIVTDSIATNSNDLFLPIKYTPKGAQIRDDTATPGEGNAAILSCWFNGYPDTEANQWQKDGERLRDDTTKYSKSVSRRYTTGITAYRMKIANVVKEDYGEYTLQVSNRFGQTGCSVKLQDPSDIINVKPAEKVFNGTECCAKKGVTELCQELCGFHIDVEEIIADSRKRSCLAFFDDLIACGADGRDHTTCCKKNAVNPYCYPFCAGNSPGSAIYDQEELLDCVSEAEQIFKCMQSGHKLIPFPPAKVIVSWWSMGRNVMVRWSRPLHNYDKIDHYFVHYRSGNGTEKVQMVNEQIQEYEIENANNEMDYFVYVTARNKWGASHNSEEAVLKAIAVPAPSKIQTSVSGSEVTLSWDNSPASSPSFDSYNIYYKKDTDARFIKISGITQPFYKFTDLKEKTTFRAYVTTQSNRGHESAPSMFRGFATGAKDSEKNPQTGSDDDDDDKKVAIAVGVIVAIFAVAAIVFLVIYLMKSRRNHQLNNDRVTFENPGYGNQGSVKIQDANADEGFGYGRLDEDRVYDNPSEASSPPQDGSVAYDNLAYAEGNADSNIATLPVNSEA